MSTGRIAGFVEGLPCLAGLDWPTPDITTLSRCQKTLAVNIPCRGSDAPLRLLIDSTAIEAEGGGEWNARRLGGAKRRRRREIHRGVEEQTPEIRAIESSPANATGPKQPGEGSSVGDAPMLPGLPGQIPASVETGSVTADGA